MAEAQQSQKSATTAVEPDYRDVRNVFKFVFAPITRDEIKYYCLIICAVMGSVMSYFVPNIVSVVLISLISAIFCLVIATFIWMLTILPHYKREQFMGRLRDVFRHGISSYLSSQRQDERSGQDKNSITHSF